MTRLMKLLAVVAVLAVAWVLHRHSKPQPVPVAVAPTPSTRVTSLGYLRPADEVVHLAPPVELAQDRVREWRVKEGDSVVRAQVLLVLSSEPRLRAAVRAAESRVEHARANLERVAAWAKPAEREAQLARVSGSEQALRGLTGVVTAELQELQIRLRREEELYTAALGKAEAEAEYAHAEWQRAESLFNQGAVPRAEFDRRRRDWQAAEKGVQEARAQLARSRDTAGPQLRQIETDLERVVRTGQADVNEARATYRSLSEVRPEDVTEAQAALDVALADLEHARARREESVVCAPQSGRLLKIHAHEGEASGAEGLAELGNTSKMAAVAEVYESDVPRIQPGQSALVSSPVFPVPISGRVQRIGARVERQQILSERPGENLDRRVVEVRIALDPKAHQDLTHFTHLQVEVEIEVGPP